MQIRIQRLDRPEETLTGTAAAGVSGAGLNIVCGPRGCYVAPPAPIAYPTFGYPVYGYGAYPYVGAVSPFYSWPVAPVVTAPYVGSYFAPRYW
jgi:hypothetical protein